MNKQEGNTELVLPIICPNCSHEIDLDMIFSILPPETKIDGDKLPIVTEDENEPEQEEN